MRQPDVLTPDSSLKISEFADLFGFSPSAVLQAIQNHRERTPQPYYSLKDCAQRWRCSRGKADAILRASRAVAIDLRTSAGNAKKSKKIYAADSIARIEKERQILAAA
jgi:hypothetical protein